MDWTALNFQDFANAFLGLVTAAITWAAFKIGRTTKPVADMPKEQVANLKGRVIEEQIKRIADSIESLARDVAKIGDVEKGFTKAVLGITETLGPLLAASAEAQQQLASRKEQELRDMIAGINSRLEEIDEPVRKPRRRV